MVKTAEDDGPRPTFGDHSDLLVEKEPGHHRFAQKVCSAPAEAPMFQLAVDTFGTALTAVLQELPWQR